MACASVRLRRAGILVGMVVMVLAYSLVSYGALPRLSPSELADMVQSNEDKVQTLHAEGERLFWPDTTIAKESAKAPGMRTEFVWAFKPPIGTMQLTSVKGEIPWFGGEVPSIQGGSRCAYNGEIVTYDHEQNLAGLKVPVLEGLIEPAGDRSTASFGFGDLGRATLWRYGKRLSDAIRKECRVCEPDMNDGAGVYRVELPGPPGYGDEVLWIDPSRGCGIVRAYGEAVGELKVTLQEVIPSVWFPKHITQTAETMRAELELTTVRINAPLSDDMFVLKFKAGTKVTDVRTGAVFTAGLPDEERTAIAEKLVDDVRQRYTSEERTGPEGVGGPKVMAIPDTEAVEQPRTRVSAESVSHRTTPYIVGLAVVVAVFAIALVLRMRRAT